MRTRTSTAKAFDLGPQQAQLREGYNSYRLEQLANNFLHMNGIRLDGRRPDEARSEDGRACHDVPIAFNNNGPRH